MHVVRNISFATRCNGFLSIAIDNITRQSPMQYVEIIMSIVLHLHTRDR